MIKTHLVVVVQLSVLLTLFISTFHNVDARPYGSSDQRLETLEKRRKWCTTSNDCGRNRYCSFGQCVWKKYDDTPCFSDRSCFSGSCDKQTSKCQSSSLSLDTRCYSSSTCASGNCQNSVCKWKQPLGAYCYKASNCASGQCDTSLKQCVNQQSNGSSSSSSSASQSTPTGTSSTSTTSASNGNTTPTNGSSSSTSNTSTTSSQSSSSSTSTGVQTQPTMQPSLPWDTVNLADPINLKPVNDAMLMYSDNGVLDMSMTKLFAALKTNFSEPAVILPHSSLVGPQYCANNVVSIPFINTDAFNYAREQWAILGNSQFILVTHTDGCNPPEVAYPDERTYWQASADQIVYDARTNTIDVPAQQVAFEDLVGDLTVNFGPLPSGSGSSNNNSTNSSGTNSTTPASNSTSPASNGGCAANPSGTTVDGLPAASCGDNFDTTLDEQLGYLDLSNESTFSTDVSEVFPGLDENTGSYSDSFEDGYEDDGSLSVPEKRWGLGSLVSGLVSKVVGPVYNAVVPQTVRDKINGAVDAAINLAQKATTLSKDIGPGELLKIDVKPPASGMAMSKKWGNQFVIFSDTITGANGNGHVGIYCVDCEVKANAGYEGTASISLLPIPSLTKAELTLSGGMHLGAYLGIEADGTYSKQYEKSILNYAIPGAGFTIPSILTVGASVQVDALMDFTASASGTLLAGAAFDIDHFVAKMDFAQLTGSSTGFTPTFTKKFEVDAQVQADLKLGLPVGIGIGMNIPKLNKDYTVAMVAAPGLDANVALQYSNLPSNSTSDATTSNSTCNNGVEYGINLLSDFYLKYGSGRYNLPGWKQSIAQSCYQLPTLPNGSTSSGSSNSTSTNGGTSNSNSTITTTGGNSTSSSNSTSTPVTDKDDPSFDNMDLPDDQAGSVQSSAITDGEQTTTDADGVNYVQIFEGSNTLNLQWGYDGSLEFVDTGGEPGNTMFAQGTQNGKSVVAGSDGDGFLVYYPDELSKYSVSRFRMANITAIPKSSDFIALMPVNVDNNPSTQDAYVPVTLTQKVLYPMACKINGEATRMFLATDPDLGATTLQSTAVQNTVTGGITSGCEVVKLLVAATS